MKEEKTIHVLMGLPGSGKTYWAEHYTRGKDFVKNVNLDTAPKKYTSPATTLDKHIQIFSYSKSYSMDYHNELILDGLFLTSTDVERILNIVEEQKELVDNIIVHYWNEDRAKCLNNDKDRRKTSSTITINNGEFIKPNISELNRKYLQNITLQEHIIIPKSEYEQFKNDYNIKADILKSDTWSNGGVSGNCWDNSMDSFGGDSPLEFTELDNLLEEIKPDITFLQYKEIRSLADVDTNTEYGYYNSSESISNWEIDVKLLYDLLIDISIL